MVDLDQLRGIASAEERALQTTATAAELQVALAEVSRIRRESLDELVGQGMTRTQLAELLGMTKSRVGQLLASGPQPERALLGTDTLAIAMGAKSEAGKHKPDAYDMVSDQTHSAAQILTDLAGAYGLKAVPEVIPPPGLVDLNRPNLVVLCSPRLLPFVGQVLRVDTKLGFEHDDAGWYLVDYEAGKTYRSPRDQGKPCDYAYVGRLPRPDGRGSFLYLAGIHGPGTHGAARFLADNITDLYQEVKTRRFSTLIEACYDPDTKAIVSTSRITPIYRHEGL